MKVDANNDVVEVYETNNVVFRALRVGPDLTVTAGVVPTPVAAGATVTASDTVKNIGGGAALQSVARFYLSTNFTLDAADVLLGSRTVAALAAGASDAGQAVLTIPSQTAAGTYYVIAVADADNAVGETVEGNNIRLICDQDNRRARRHRSSRGRRSEVVDCAGVRARSFKTRESPASTPARTKRAPGTPAAAGCHVRF